MTCNMCRVCHFVRIDVIQMFITAFATNWIYFNAVSFVSLTTRNTRTDVLFENCKTRPRAIFLNKLHCRNFKRLFGRAYRRVARMMSPVGSTAGFNTGFLSFSLFRRGLRKRANRAHLTLAKSYSSVIVVRK